MRRILFILVMCFVTIASLSPAAFAKSFDKSVADGKQVFADNCASCHGADGSGGVGPALNSKSKLESLGLEKVRHDVEEGIEGTPMPAWKGVLSDEEIEDVVHYIFNEWADLVIAGIEMWPWEIAYVVIGSIWTILGLYYVIRV